MTEQRQIERLKRDRNLLININNRVESINVRLEKENEYLKERDKTLVAIEKSLPQRIKKYQKQSTNEAKAVAKELEWWYDMLMDEKQAIECKGD